MMKKKTLRKLLLLIIVLIVGTGIYYYMNINNNSYNENAVNAAKELKIDDKLNDNEYSKTIEKFLTNNLYNDDFFDEYLVIKYIEDESFLDNTNILLEKGYSGEEINNIYTLSSNNQGMILKYDYMDINKYVDIENFNVDNYNRYENYYKETNFDINTVVTYVNIGLDQEQYTNISQILNPGELNVLVNKYNQLPSDYIPEDLVSIPGYENLKLDKKAGEKLLELLAGALTENFVIEPYSAYRSYSYQSGLYNNYATNNGASEADTYSARAGHSEHQTGLAVDIKEPIYSLSTVSDEAYNWLLENAHIYGFIVRYTENTTNITGYIEEPWHLRYLGTELASAVVESNLTYDEYYDIYIKAY